MAGKGHRPLNGRGEGFNVRGRVGTAGSLVERSALLVRVGPWCGLVAAFSFLAFFLTATLLDPMWRMGGMWLSDLGVRQAAWAFNTGCVLAGLLIIPFALSAPHLFHRGPLTWAGAAFFMHAGVFLVGVGVFTEHFGVIHGIVSFGFFGSLLLGWILMPLPMHRTPAFGGYGGFLNLGALGVTFGSMALFNAFTVEAVVVLVAVYWGIITAGLLLPRGAGTPAGIGDASRL